MKIQPISASWLREYLSEQEQHHLPKRWKQLGQLFLRSPQYEHSDTEENQDKHRLRRIRMFDDLTNLIDQQLRTISILILSAWIEDETYPFEGFYLFFGLECVAAE